MYLKPWILRQSNVSSLTSSSLTPDQPMPSIGRTNAQMLSAHGMLPTSTRFAPTVPVTTSSVCSLIEQGRHVRFVSSINSHLDTLGRIDKDESIKKKCSIIRWRKATLKKENHRNLEEFYTQAVLEEFITSHSMYTVDTINQKWCILVWLGGERHEVPISDSKSSIHSRYSLDA